MKTPEPRFILKNPKADRPTLIYLIARFDNQRFKYSTGESIHPELWDFDNQIPTNDSKLRKKHDIFKGTLTDIKVETGKYANFFVETFRTLKLSGKTFTPKDIKDQFDKEFKPSRVPEPEKPKEPEKENLFQWIKRYAVEVKLNHRGEPIQPRTRKKYRTTLRHLREFSEKEGVKVDFETIDKSFYDGFVSYLYGKKFARNTVGHYVAALKTMLYEARQQGLIESNTFEKFRVPEEETSKHYLNENELVNLYRHDFSNNTRLEKVRDLFIVGCFTGLRFSDFTTLRDENIVNNGSGQFIKKRMAKTNDFVVIPIHWIVKEILEKYDYILPRAISNQKMNHYIKEVCYHAAINDMVDFKGQTVPKWKAISTHSARRSFATNAYLSGIPSISIRKITGHRTEAAFMRYIQIDELENAIHIQNHKFFKKGTE